MKANELETLKDWFNDYIRTFESDDDDINKNIILKHEHTKRVCQEIIDIGGELNLNENELYLAEAMALFHDVGRFEQYTKYRTFLDLKSENHAELSVKILKENNVLKIIKDEEKRLILKTISYHNRKVLPENETETCLFFAKLLRDADKLDIWKVVTDYYQRRDDEKNGAIELGLPDLPEFSDDACNNLIDKKIVGIEQIRTMNDFKMLQIGWIYDVNFVATFRKVREREYLEIIRRFLPKSKKIDYALEIAQGYILEKIKHEKNYHRLI